MEEYWENKFRDIKTNWGSEPANSAIQNAEFFKKHHIQNVLFPGIGYGRNAQIFVEKGIHVTGIEISKTAIQLAKTIIKLDIPIHNGSVTQMPFDNELYDGIYCYSLVHLLNYYERKKFIKDCFHQLKPKGYMIFVVVSKKASMYGIGLKLSNNRFQIMKGLSVYFYDLASATKEFESYGSIDVQEFEEPIKHMVNEPPLKCIIIKCQKK
jgi:2-polyprenyl-3-methyl-5-hydroxy-6-metoxy-1,4-benzoquinol methylase